MATNPAPKRRDFLKTAAAGAAGAVGLSALKFDKLFAQSTGGWVAGMQINPAIDNKRVICCHDTKMLTSTPANTSFTTTNNAVDAAVVAANLDQMAMQLAQKTTAAEAWSTIFRSSKPWASTKVAMKTNGIGGTSTNRPKWAIYKKICDVLVGLGVQPANIVLYDACDNAATYYNPFISLTDATKIRAAQVSVRAAGMGGFKAVTLTNATAISVATDLADGNIDILVNVAACKMHNGTGGRYSYGSCTLCMKNHLGTFTSGTQAQYSNNLHNLQALFEINKHSALLGGTPVRQQLCIVDALLSNGASGPGGGWDNRTDRLVMGTFAPIVDYLSATNILLNSTIMASSPIPQAGITAAAPILPQFLTSFGYAATDPQWIAYEASSPPAINPSGTGGTSGTGGNTGAGGTTGSGGTTASGGTTGSGGTTRTGGNTASGGRAGGNTASGGRAGGNTGMGGTTATGGTSAIDTGGTTATGGTTSAGGTSTTGGTTTSSAAGGTSGSTTSVASASGGSSMTGGTSSATTAMGGTTTSAPSASGGSTMTGTTATGAKSGGGGCSVAGVDRRVTRWGAMLTLGAVVAEKLRRLVGSGDHSS